MKRFNHGLIVGFAVLLLAAVFFVGCEGPAGPAGMDGSAGPGGPTGPTGPGATASQELNQFGYTFGEPIHTTRGRNAVYVTTIVGNVSIGSAGPTLVAGVLTFQNGGTSATLTTAAGQVATSSLVATLTTLFTNSGIGLTADTVTSGSNVYLRITGPSTPFSVTGTANNLTAAFGTAPRSNLHVAGANEEWTFPLVELPAGTSIAPSQVSWGGKFYPFADGTTTNGIGAVVENIFGDTDWTVADSSGDLVFTAGSPGSRSAPPARPKVESNSDLDTFGYTFVTEITSPGVQASGSGSVVPEVPSKKASTLVQSGTTAVAAAGDTITVTYAGKKDYILFGAALTGGLGTGSAITNSVAAGLIQTPATEVTVTVVSNLLTFEAPHDGTMTVTFSAGLCNATTGLVDVGEGTLTDAGTAYDAGAISASAEEVTLTVVGGNDTDTHIEATRVSAVKVTSGSLTATAAIPALTPPEGASNSIVHNTLLAVNGASWTGFGTATEGSSGVNPVTIIGKNDGSAINLGFSIN